MNKLRRFLDNHLDPSERLGAVLFGVLMVLTLMLPARSTITDDGSEGMQELLWSVLGCNVAWGLISGMMFIMDAVFERSRTIQRMHAVQRSATEAEAIALVEDEWDTDLAPITSQEERTRLYAHMVAKLKIADLPKSRFQRGDFWGATIVCVLVILTTAPALLPFFLFDDLLIALRISNSLLIGLLFFVGYCWGQLAHMNPWMTAVSMTLLGLIMVSIAEVLGG